MIAIVLVIGFFIHGAHGAVSLIRNRILIYEKGLVIGKAFRTKEIRNEQIDHFDWVITTYWAGFIPVGKRTECSIFSKETNSKLAHVSSNLYSGVNKKMLKVEERLEI